MFGGGGASSPFFVNSLTFPPFVDGNRIIDGRVAVSAKKIAGQRTRVILIFGQSLVCNYAQGPYTQQSDKVHEISLHKGGCFESQSTMLSVDGTMVCFAAEMADMMIAAGDCERVVLLNVGVGGTDIYSYTPGQILANRITAACNRLKAAGLEPTVVGKQLGTTDAAGGTTLANYVARADLVFGVIRTFFPTVPIVIAQDSWTGAATNATIRAAQAQLWDASKRQYQGPDIDLITAPGDRYDTVHLAAQGRTKQAIAWRASINAALAA